MRYFMLVVLGDVEPQLRGPYKSDKHRLRAARRWRRGHGDEDGLFRINVRGEVGVESFGGGETG